MQSLAIVLSVFILAWCWHEDDTRPAAGIVASGWLLSALLFREATAERVYLVPALIDTAAILALSGLSASRAALGALLTTLAALLINLLGYIGYWLYMPSYIYEALALAAVLAQFTALIYKTGSGYYAGAKTAGGELLGRLRCAVRAARASEVAR